MNVRLAINHALTVATYEVTRCLCQRFFVSVNQAAISAGNCTRFLAMNCAVKQTNLQMGSYQFDLNKGTLPT